MASLIASGRMGSSASLGSSPPRTSTSSGASTSGISSMSFTSGSTAVKVQGKANFYVTNFLTMLLILSMLLLNLVSDDVLVFKEKTGSMVMTSPIAALYLLPRIVQNEHSSMVIWRLWSIAKILPIPSVMLIFDSSCFLLILKAIQAY